MCSARLPVSRLRRGDIWLSRKASACLSEDGSLTWGRHSSASLQLAVGGARKRHAGHGSGSDLGMGVAADVRLNRPPGRACVLIGVWGVDVLQCHLRGTGGLSPAHGQYPWNSSRGTAARRGGLRP